MYIYPLDEIYSKALKTDYPVCGAGGGNVEPIDPAILEKLLSFTALDQDTTMTIRRNNYISFNNLQYTFGVKWKKTADTGDVTIVIPYGQTVYIKAENFQSSKYNGQGVINHNHDVSVGGDVTSLLNGIGGDVALTTNYTFKDLFKDNQHITNCANLPSTNISEGCYMQMYYNCSKITTIPNNYLISTTAPDYCYQGMFCQNTNLTAIPDNLLKATSAGISAYNNMFGKCSSLTSLPTNFLQTTSFGKMTCTQMFVECTNLLDLSNVIINVNSSASNSFDSTFKSCTSLTKTPLFQGTSQPSNNCFDYCFYGDTSLTDAYADFPGTWSAMGFNYWLHNVSGSGTLHNLGGATGIPNSASGYPSGWTLSAS